MNEQPTLRNVTPPLNRVTQCIRGGAVILGMFAAFMLLSASRVEAATCTFASAGTHDWNTDANWSCGHAPSSSDDAVIPAATSTSISATASAGTLLVGAGANVTSTGGFVLSIISSSTNNGIIYVNGGAVNFASGATATTTNNGTISVTEDVSGDSFAYFIGGFRNSGTLTMDIDSDILIYSFWNNSGGICTVSDPGPGGTVLGSFSFIQGENQTIPGGITVNSLVINKDPGSIATLGGDVTSTGNVSIPSGTLALSSATLRVGGGWSDDGTLVGGTGTVEFNGTDSQVISVEPNFYLLSFTNQGGAVDLGGGTVSAASSTTIAAGTIFQMVNDDMHVGGNWVDNGTLFPGTGTLTFNGSGSQSIGPEASFGKLSINKATGTAALVTSVTSTSNFTLASSTFSLAGNTFAVSNNWTNTGGTFVPAGGTVRFTGAATITNESNFGNVVISGSSSFNGFGVFVGSTVSFANDTPISGVLTLRSGRLSLGTRTVTLSGSGTPFVLATASPIFAPGTGTVSYTGVSPSMASTTFYNLTFAGSGTATFSGASTTVSNNVTISSGTVNLGANTVHVRGGWTDTAAFLGGTGTVDFTGPGTQTVSAEPGFFNLTKTGTSTLALGGVVVIGGSVTSSAGTINAQGNALSVSGTTMVLSSATVTSTSGIVTYVGAVSSTGSLGSSSGGLVFNSTLQNNGTVSLGTGSSTAVGTITNAGTLHGGAATFHLRGDWSNTGTFNAGSGTFDFAGTGAKAVTGSLFNNVTFTPASAGTYTLSSSSTVLGTLSLNASATLVVGANTLNAVGAITNAGLVTETSGTIIHAVESVDVTDGSGTPVATLSTGGSFFVTVHDGNRNLDGSTIETMTIPVTLDSAAGSDSETLTLTETSAASGIFRNTAGLSIANASASPSSGQFEITASGSGDAAYTDVQDPTDTGSGTVSITLVPTTSGGSGGGGGGGGGLSASGGSGGGLAPYTPVFQSITTGGNGENGAPIDPRASHTPSPQQTASNLLNLERQNLRVHELVKLSDGSAVYYIGKDGQRHAFPNDKIYFTWYKSFDEVVVVNLMQLSSVPLGLNVTYKPGVKMVKFVTDPKVYAVAKNGILRWVTTEDVAKNLYGANWSANIDDLSDAFYGDYLFGSAINSPSDFDPAAVAASVTFPSDSLGI